MARSLACRVLNWYFFFLYPNFKEESLLILFHFEQLFYSILSLSTVECTLDTGAVIILYAPQEIMDTQ